MIRLAVAAALFALPGVAAATAPAAQAGADRATARACRSVAGLKDAAVLGAPIRFSDDTGMDARLVRGVAPQPFMKGARITMLCLYDRRAKRAEAQEWPTALTRALR